MTDQEAAAVECYSGHGYAGEPRALVWSGQRLLVEAVRARWRTPQGPAFRIEAAGGALFELHYREGDDRWSVVPL